MLFYEEYYKTNVNIEYKFIYNFKIIYATFNKKKEIKFKLFNKNTLFFINFLSYI